MLGKSQIWVGAQPSSQSPLCWHYRSKITQKLISKFSDLVQFRLTFLFFQLYFPEDCSCTFEVLSDAMYKYKHNNKYKAIKDFESI